jgi:hypothetical protein
MFKKINLLFPRRNRLTYSCKLGFFGMRASFKGPQLSKKHDLHTNELNITYFLLDEPPKGYKSLKIFKISL